MNEVPVFINCRDRLTPLVALVDYLERAGCERVILLDNASTYPPLLEYYERTPHTVIRLGENSDHEWFWESGLLDELGVRGRYVFSDPDTIPIEECPLDAIEYFAEVLDRYPRYKKVGFGLKIDDLPDHFRLKEEVIAWESRFWHRLVAPRLYAAPIDTTFALYRGAERARRHAIRTGYPYLVRHTSWYQDSADLSEEDRYYFERARADVTTWTGDATPPRMDQKFAWIAARPSVPVAVEAGPSLAEVEFRELAATLARLVEPATVIEVGAGDGRLDEVKTWWYAAQPGAVLLVHENRYRPDALQGCLAPLVRELGIPGVFLENPRGAFLGIRPA